MAITETAPQPVLDDDAPRVWVELAGGVAGHWITVEQMFSGRVVFDDVPPGWYPYVLIDAWRAPLDDGEGVTLNTEGRLTVTFQVCA